MKRSTLSGDDCPFSSLLPVGSPAKRRRAVSQHPPDPAPTSVLQQLLVVGNVCRQVLNAHLTWQDTCNIQRECQMSHEMMQPLTGNDVCETITRSGTYLQHAST